MKKETIYSLYSFFHIKLKKKLRLIEENQMDKMFLETKQADKKLNIALLRYFDLESEDKKKNGQRNSWNVHFL